MKIVQYYEKAGFSFHLIKIEGVAAASPDTDRVCAHEGPCLKLCVVAIFRHGH